MIEKACRWGFLSTAAIARKNWKAIRLSGNGCVTAVASRSLTRAKTFINECEAEVPQLQDCEALGSYDELLQRDDVDAVYVPIPTGIRKEWVIKAAQAGKHVLCEKPVAINASDAKEMTDACAAAGVQFMDGVMFDHSARLAGLRATLDDQAKFGNLRRINTHFSFCGDKSFENSNIRANQHLEPHGALGDLGWYCIRFMLWTMRGEMPTHVSARTTVSLGGAQTEGHVPGEMSAELAFPGGVTGSFFCSFRTVNQQTAILSGERGYLSIDDFVLPFYDSEVSWNENQHVLEIDNCRWNFRRHQTRQCVVEYASGEPNAQEVNMVRAMAALVISGELDASYPKIALDTQRVLDACRQSDAANGKLVEL